MYRYETHLHTYPVSACASNTPAEMVRAYKAMGYTGFIITEHFLNGNTSCPPHLPWEKKIDYFLESYRQARAEAAQHDFDVFLGWEYGIQGTEFLTYGLTESFLYNNPNVHTLSLEEYAPLVRKNNGYLAQAHPYRTAPWVRNPFPVAPHLIDGIEAFNAGQPPDANQKALDFALLHHLPIQAGTDAHSAAPHIPSGILLQKRPATIHALIIALKEKQVELILPK